MLLWLAEYLGQFYSGFNVFQYLTLRAILGVLTSLLIAFLIGPFFIKKLGEKQIVQHVRDEGPVTHKTKSGTPTMGGVLIIISISFSTICWSDLGNRFVWIALFVILMFSAIGWFDDHRKIVLQSPNGLSAKHKYFLQSIISISAALFLYYSAVAPSETQLIIPFIKSIVIDLGWFYVVLAYFVIIGSSNAVNLTDGLDGLAIMPTVMVAGALAIFAYVAGHLYFAGYLGLPYVPGAGEIVVFCGTIVGSGLGFLWFNTYPAQVFMGDIGALSLGAALGVVALIVRQELVLFIMGGIFVIETITVILQLGYYRLTGKRIFRMAPLHHHYELKGWQESQVVVRFWIITVILILIGLASLKIR